MVTKFSIEDNIEKQEHTVILKLENSGSYIRLAAQNPGGPLNTLGVFTPDGTFRLIGLVGIQGIQVGLDGRMIID